MVITATSERVHVRRDELRAEGLDVAWGVADLSVPEQVEALVADKGPFDVLVNNAGMTSVITGSESGSLAATDPATWQASLDRNLSTAFHATRAVVPGMVSRGFGRVVMVSSVTGPLVAYPGDVAYAAAKAGLVGLTRALAVELGASGVTVNAVLPGWIATGSSTQQERVMGQRHTGRSGRDTPPRSPRRWASSPPARLRTSPARCWWSTAGTRSRKTRGDRLHRHGRRWCRRSPVLLLHGFPQDLGCWDGVVALLARDGFRCARYDQRGYDPGCDRWRWPSTRCRCWRPTPSRCSTTSGGRTRWWSATTGARSSAGRWPRGTRSGCAGSSRCRCRTLGPTRAPSTQIPDQQARSAYLGLFRQPAGRAEDLLLADGGRRLRAVYGDVPEAAVDRYVARFLEPGAMTGALAWYRAMDRTTFSGLEPVAVPTRFVWGADDVAVGRVAAEACGGWVTGATTRTARTRVRTARARSGLRAH